MSIMYWKINLLWLILLSYFLIKVRPSDTDEDTRKLSRKKRSTCHPKYSVISGHTACLMASGSVLQSGVTTAEQTEIVTVHNNFRSAVNPTAADMTAMTWDEEIASIAQKWAENCQTQHDSNYNRFIPGRLQAGQNLAWGSAKMGWTAAITLWHNEVQSFTYGGSNSLLAVGHYTQMVWAKSTKIGCGYAECGSTHYYVCNYSPPGNFDINRPYTSGTSCSQCPNHCNNNLCDCGGLVCLNGGTLNLNTCTCTCKNYPHYVGANCALDCSLLSEYSLCGSGVYAQSNCQVYSNVPFDCPGTCDVCPYGGIDYVSAGTTLSTPIGHRTGTLMKTSIFSIYVLLMYMFI